eukprot:COSAG06_NODE_23128_length_701_cov_116.255814_1_plen_159_part_01
MVCAVCVGGGCCCAGGGPQYRVSACCGLSRETERDTERVSLFLVLALFSLFSLCVCVCVFGSAWMRSACLAVERWLIRALRQWPLCAQTFTGTHRRPILHLPVVGRSSSRGRHPHQQSRGCRPACNQPISASNTMSCVSSDWPSHNMTSAQHRHSIFRP